MNSDSRTPPPVERREIVSWAMYDFAHSAFGTLVVTFIFSAYYAQAIHPDPIEGAIWWTRAVNASAIITALSMPVIGAMGDFGGLKKRFLTIATVVCVALTAVLFRMGPGDVWAAALVFVGASVAYESLQSLSNAFLPEISTRENMGRISGLGWGLGYFGGLLCLIPALGMVTGWLPEDGGLNVRATNLLAAGWLLVFSVPLATPGLKIICRDHYGLDADPFDRPFSSRFDEQDAFVVFDDVEVPRHRVFLDGDPATYNAVMARGWTGNVMQQTSIRAMVKLEFAYELCCRMAETIGQNRRPEVMQMLGEIWSYAELTRAAIRAAEADAHEFGDGVWFCAEAPFRALRPTLPGWMPRVNEIIKLIGSHNLLATPSRGGLASPELRPWLDRYLPGADDGDASERSRLFRTAWDFAGSALGARTELYERYYLASAARTYALAHISARKDREWAQVPTFWDHMDSPG